MRDTKHNQTTSSQIGSEHTINLPRRCLLHWHRDNNIFKVVPDCPMKRKIFYSFYSLDETNPARYCIALLQRTDNCAACMFDNIVRTACWIEFAWSFLHLLFIPKKAPHILIVRLCLFRLVAAATVKLKFTNFVNFFTKFGVHGKKKMLDVFVSTFLWALSLSALFF